MPAHDFDLDTFFDLPRVEGLALSHDGMRLVAAVARRDAKGTRFRTALWSLDLDGDAPPQRLTWSAAGESDPRFLPDGGLLFTSARPDPDAADDDDDDEVAALWVLPQGAGEARLVTAPPSGLSGVAVARDAGTVAVAASAHPGAADWAQDDERATARKDAGVKAQLYDRYPIRFWDHYLGPRQRRLYAPVTVPADEPADEPAVLTAVPGFALEETPFDLTPDGATVVTAWDVDPGDLVHRRYDLIAIDVASGQRRVLIDDGGHHAELACSPDGQHVAVARERAGSPSEPLDISLILVDLPDGTWRDLTPDLDLWPTTPVWTADGSAVLCTADELGHRPILRVPVDGGPVVRLTATGEHSAVCTGRDGAVYALRSSVGAPPCAVVLDATTPDQAGRRLPTPGADAAVPGRVEAVVATASDGAQVRSWLVLPDTDEPAPLAVFIHGGPLGSWNGWHWRWNPHVLAARGWAVLLPDPALSTGYGQDFVRRGWGRWGAEPYTDLMAAVDAAVARPDVDAERTAALGGSFGGYMANWVAGHTNRFCAIVTHASLWGLRGFHGTTDAGTWWEQEFGDPYADASRYEEASPDAHIGAIRTPMLVIHGEQDHRVPISEALRLWTDLARHHVQAQFLYFPDENHWILKPQHARVWYETVLAFLDHHVLGREWQRPDLL